MMNGYVYTGTLSSSDLEELLQGQCPDAVRLSWNLERLDFSGNLRDEGLAFTSEYEVRWHRLDEDCFRVLVLSDEPLSLSDKFRAVGGDWQVKEEMTELISCSAPRFYPSFHSYPGAGDKARLRCHAFYRDHTIVFLSPREVQGYEPTRD